MAKITIVEDTPVPPPKKYILELTEEEMFGLIDIADHGKTGQTTRSAVALSAVWDAACDKAVQIAARASR